MQVWKSLGAGMEEPKGKNTTHRQKRIILREQRPHRQTARVAMKRRKSE